MSRESLAGFSIPADPAEAARAGYKSVPQGAATAIWAAIVAPADAMGGRYCEDCHLADVDDTPGAQEGVASYAVERKRAAALWKLSEALVGETF